MSQEAETGVPKSVIISHKDHFVKADLHVPLEDSSDCDSPVSLPTNMGARPSGLHKKNESLERESLGCCSVVFYSSIFLLLDVWKQVASYGMKYFNNNIYPVPQTKIVAVTEMFKFLCFVCLVMWTSGFSGLRNMRISPWYAIPSLIYAINNNIYYYALHFATPPVWNVLIQLRIVFTALTYRVMFKRNITDTQWAGLGLLITAVVLTNFTGGQTLLGQDQKLLVAMFLATLGSCTSVIGTLTMEVL